MPPAAPQASPSPAALTERLGQSGLRATRQRELIYGILLENRDHPTADEVYAHAKQAMASISLATVYNCLETLVAHQLVKQVNFERQPTRFCPNLHEHAHFHDESTGRVYDIALDDRTLSRLRTILPSGFEPHAVDITFRGVAARNRTRSQAARRSAAAR